MFLKVCVYFACVLRVFCVKCAMCAKCVKCA